MYVFETIFDVVYLILVLLLGFATIRKSNGKKQYLLLGIMAVILGFGDAFHLVPRVISMWTQSGFEGHRAALGYGQMVTSITMTIFYVLLYYAWKIRYARKNAALTSVIWGLAVIRIALCIFPQNDWAGTNPPLSWGIYRNIPFTILGILIVVLFYQQAKQQKDTIMRYMWLAVVISFGCYLPVVLFASIVPPIGALMMPKTVAYVWIVWMGYRAANTDFV